MIVLNVSGCGGKDEYQPAEVNRIPKEVQNTKTEVQLNNKGIKEKYRTQFTRDYTMTLELGKKTRFQYYSIGNKILSDNELKLYKSRKKMTYGGKFNEKKFYLGQVIHSPGYRQTPVYYNMLVSKGAYIKFNDNINLKLKEILELKPSYVKVKVELIKREE